MLESGLSGSVRGVPSNGHPYRDPGSTCGHRGPIQHPCERYRLHQSEMPPRSAPMFSEGQSNIPSAVEIDLAQWGMRTITFALLCRRGHVMKLQRRRFLNVAAGVAALPLASRIARAQAYPARPVRIIVGFAAGGTTDIITRLIAQWLSERTGGQFIVENRPGASTNIATEAGARAPADGYTLTIVGSTHAINATLYDRLPVNLVRDYTFVAGINESPLVLEVHPSVPAKTVPEFIAYAKTNPGKINMASFGTGSISHVAGELFKMETGTNIVHVPYRGSAPMITDLLGGQVQATFDNLPASVEYIRTGKLRALAVTSADRSEAISGLPILSDFLPGYQATALFGIAAPKNTPTEIIDKLNREINAGLGDPKIKARFADLGGAPLVLSPAAFGTLIGDEVNKWGKVVRAANIKPE
jgi:tripartite-type tricarboxylate transporter receptor subunit TctC